MFQLIMDPAQNSKELRIENWDEQRWGPLSTDAMVRKLESEGYQCIDYTFSPGIELYVQVNHVHLSTGTYQHSSHDLNHIHCKCVILKCLKRRLVPPKKHPYLTLFSIKAQLIFGPKGCRDVLHDVCRFQGLDRSSVAVVIFVTARHPFLQFSYSLQWA